MDREALDAGVWQHRVSMARLAASILHSPQDVEDAVSEAVLRAYAAADQFTLSPGLEAAMLRAAARAPFAGGARRRLGRLVAAALLASLLLVALPSPCGRADALQHLGSARACQPSVMLI